MPSIRARLDPNGTLPVVELDPYEVMDWTTEKREKMAILADGKDIGHCAVYSHLYDGGRKAHFDGVTIEDENYRGRGYGLATYVTAIETAHERGLDFVTQDYNQTSYAKKIWETLAANGIAEVIEPFQPLMDPNFKDRFVGKYRIPAPLVTP